MTSVLVSHVNVGRGERYTFIPGDEVMIEWTPAKKTVAACAVIGVGLLVVSSRRRYREHNGAPIVLDPDLDSDTRRVVLVALAHEHDPEVLRVLATKLGAVGHDKTASVVSKRAGEVARGNGTSRISGYVVGQAGTNIRWAQSMLQKLGYDVPLSGVYDSRTREAVERFQSLHDLNIDGILGEDTFRMLRALTGGS